MRTRCGIEVLLRHDRGSLDPVDSRKKPTSKRPRKPNSSSVTSVPCKCRFLERASEEPTIPIVFDARVNEYHITNVGKDRRGHTNVYHCPFCGGAAPLSRRHSLFATITSTEAERLYKLTSGMKTCKEVVAKFGEPDDDLDPGMQSNTPGSDTEPPKVVSYRTLTYKRLSKTAEVVFIDYGPERGVRTSLRGKYVGDRS
jgi:hypothetical protein